MYGLRGNTVKCGYVVFHHGADKKLGSWRGVDNTDLAVPRHILHK